MRLKHTGIIVLLVCFSFGCISLPTESKLALTPGKSKSQTDRSFAYQNNKTGRWVSSLIRTEMKEEGTQRVYIYRWTPTNGYSMPEEIHDHYITFLNGDLVSCSVMGADEPRRFQCPFGLDRLYERRSQ